MQIRNAKSPQRTFRYWGLLGVTTSVIACTAGDVVESEETGATSQSLEWKGGCVCLPTDECPSPKLTGECKYPAASNPDVSCITSTRCPTGEINCYVEPDGKGCSSVGIGIERFCDGGYCGKCSGCYRRNGLCDETNEELTSCGAKGQSCVNCNDGNECTADKCDVTSTIVCVHAPVDNGTPCNSGAGVCSDGNCKIVGIGGSTSTGGSSATGGTTSTGGSSATGGTTSTGGSSATGGTSATGGSKTTGGTASIGGSSATGGSKTTGGTASTDSPPSNGGAVSNGGSPIVGGSVGVGGTTINGSSEGSSVTGGRTQVGRGGSNGTGGRSIFAQSGKGGARQPNAGAAGDGGEAGQAGDTSVEPSNLYERNPGGCACAIRPHRNVVPVGGWLALVGLALGLRRRRFNK